MKKNLSIVLFNYVQPTEKNTPGGGVSVYLKNIKESLLERGHTVYTLSSGDRYSLIKRKPYLKINTNGEIIIFNSPVVAPAIFSIHEPNIYLSDESLNHIPKQLKKSLKDIDIFHFQNIEGLTLDFFYRLRKEFPRSALIYSAHNYSTICPQVNLWKNDQESCLDFDNGKACQTCSPHDINRSRKIMINTLKTSIKSISWKRLKFIEEIAYKADSLIKKIRKASPQRKTNKSKNIDYVSYRQQNMALINNVFDKTIAVSQRTYNILKHHGANAEKLQLSYIGTKHYEKLNHVAKKHPHKGNLHICYIGYMRKDKGFFFFLEALEQINPTDAKDIEVTIAAKFTDELATKKMLSMSNKFKRLHTFNGYTHNTLPEILKPVNLGIVPPLWEDNLPQVAIEFVTHGIPILTSTMGGASEISKNENYTFEISSPRNLKMKIVEFSKSTELSEKFWDYPINIHSNYHHSDSLSSIYEDTLEKRKNLILTKEA